MTAAGQSVGIVAANAWYDPETETLSGFEFGGRVVLAIDPLEWPSGTEASFELRFAPNVYISAFLVKDPLVLSGDLQVEKLERVNGMLEATMSQARKPQEGKVIVRLAENPLLLRGWTIVDNRGNRVTVSLSDMQTGLQLADSLFKNESGR